MLKKNEIYRTTVSGFTSEGLGVCRVDGCAVFVPNAAPNEEYDIRVEHVGKNAAYGKIVSIINRSDQRVNRACPYAKQCGGCDFWHITYSAECEIKRQRVLDALNRIGGQDLTHIEITGAGTCERYRNKVQFPVANGKAGFYKKGTHDLIPIEHCLIQPKCADEAKEAVLQWMRECKIPSYDEETHTGLIRHIFVRYGEKTGQILVCLVCNGQELPKRKRLIDLLTTIPGMTSIAMNVNTRKGNAIMGDTTKTLWGKDSIEDILCGLRFRISPRSFYQVNREQAEILYEKAIACAELTGKETVLDLYCGTGTITLCLAQKAGKVIGVEVIDAAIQDAKENARRNGIENAEFFCADAGEAAKKLCEEGNKPHVIVVDPPRKGLSADVIEAIAAMRPEKVVYVSCDPATLGRDVKLLCEKGYKLTHAEAVDLFPRCSHVESVVCLSRNTTHEMKLHPSPFEKIKSGAKNIELRLFDEKRQKIKIGDTIIFTNTANGEKMCVTVEKLHQFGSFAELYKALPLLQCGYTADNVNTAHPSDMERYYSAEEQKKYGVLGIELFPS